MNTQEILSIVALSLLGLCLLCGLAKMAMKGDSAKKNCDKACSMAVFAAVVLLAISQLIGETDGYCRIMTHNNGYCHAGQSPTTLGACGPSDPGPGGVSCPAADECGTINDQSSDNATHNPKGVVTPCTKEDAAGNCTDQKSVAQWWKNNCAAPTPSPSQ